MASVQSARPQGRGLTTLCLTLQGQDPGSRLLLVLEYLALSPPLILSPALLLGACPARHSPLGTGCSMPWQLGCQAFGYHPLFTRICLQPP